MSSFVARNRWWLTRLAVLPLHLLAFSVVVFFLVRMIPGDPILTMTDGEISPEKYAEAQAALGLDGSLLEQFARYIGQIVRLDLGNALMSGRPVVSDIQLRLPATLELALIGLVAVGTFTLVSAYVMVMRPKNPVSRVLRAYARAAGAVPEFVIGVAAIFIFYATLQWAPAPLGRVPSNLRMPESVTGMPLLDSVLRGQWDVAWSMSGRLVLPIMVMALGHSAVLIKLLSRSLDEALEAPPTRFRIASGAPRFVVVVSMYRRALPAAATLYGVMFGNLIGGAVILEALFGFSGMGRYAIDAVNTSDIVALQGFLLVVAVLTLVVFLLVDLTNMLLDPRRRPGVRMEET